MKKNILISTGGSGGHVVPATIFYEHLKKEFNVYLSSDKRGIKFLDKNKYNVEIIDTPNLSNNIFLLPFNFFLLILSFIKSIIYLKKNKINFLISTGGYMSIPLCLAAKIFNLKIYLFEPNMVLGRMNSFFLRFSEKIFCYSNELINFPKKYLNKICLILPLLRREFYSYKTQNHSEVKSDEFNLLIIGGSQGAKFFEKSLKKEIMSLSNKFRIKVFHQISSNKSLDLENFYNKNNIEYQIFNFQENITEIIKNTNLCITRAGASTLSELIFFNVPFIAIPYPFARDNHQFYNALFYEKKIAVG